MCEDNSPECVSVGLVSAWCQRRLSGPLELELQIVASHHVAAGDLPCVFCS